MPKWLPKSCSVCKARADDGVAISRRGLCGPCAERRVADAVKAMRTKRGPIAAKWKASQGVHGRPPARKGVGGTPVAKRPTTGRKRAS